MLSAEKSSKRLGAVAGLQQERLAARRPGRATSVRTRASPANTSGGIRGDLLQRPVERRRRRASRAAARPGRRATSTATRSRPRHRVPVARVMRKAFARAAPPARLATKQDASGPAPSARAVALGWRAMTRSLVGRIRRRGCGRRLSRRPADGPLDEAAGGLGGDAELLADLAEAALALAVERGRSGARPRSGPACRDVPSSSSSMLARRPRPSRPASGPWRRVGHAGRRAWLSPSSPIGPVERDRRGEAVQLGVARRRARRRRPTTWRSAARRLAERSPGRRTRLAFWSRARPMAWRIQNVA